MEVTKIVEGHKTHWSRLFVKLCSHTSIRLFTSGAIPKLFVILLKSCYFLLGCKDAHHCMAFNCTLLSGNQTFSRLITSDEKDGAVSGISRWRGDGNRVQDRLYCTWSSAPQLSLLQLTGLIGAKL